MKEIYSKDMIGQQDFLIWTYLDGHASAEEQNKVSYLLKSDEQFKVDFENAQLIHQGLQHSIATGSRKDLFNRTIAKLEASRQITLKKKSLSKTPLYLVLSICAIIFVLAVLNTNGLSSIIAKLKTLSGQYIPIQESLNSLPQQSFLYTTYCLVALMLIYIADHLIGKKKLSGRLSIF